MVTLDDLLRLLGDGNQDIVDRCYENPQENRYRFHVSSMRYKWNIWHAVDGKAWDIYKLTKEKIYIPELSRVILNLPLHPYFKLSHVYFLLLVILITSD